MVRIGVLALQGDFSEHVQALSRLRVKAPEVRRIEELEGLDGLVIPGGESTTICRLMQEAGLLEVLRKKVGGGFSVWGTCAGMIVLAKHVAGLSLPNIGAMEIEVARNAFGRQIDSFEEDIQSPVIGRTPFRAIFIRAPKVVKVYPPANVIACLEDGTPVAVRQGNLLATSFHPELTNDHRFHRYFLDMVHGEGGEGASKP